MIECEFVRDSDTHTQVLEIKMIISVDSSDGKGKSYLNSESCHNNFDIIVMKVCRVEIELWHLSDMFDINNTI